MDTLLEEQHPDLSWEDFINDAEGNYSAHATRYEGPARIPSLDNFHCPDISTADFCKAPSSQGIQSQPVYGDGNVFPACVNQTCQQQSMDMKEMTSNLKEIKALLEETSRQTYEMKRCYAALHPYLEAIRSTLKALTERVDPRWEVITPATPRKDAMSRNVVNKAGHR